MFEQGTLESNALILGMRIGAMGNEKTSITFVPDVERVLLKGMGDIYWSTLNEEFPLILQRFGDTVGMLYGERAENNFIDNYHGSCSNRLRSEELPEFSSMEHIEDFFQASELWLCGDIERHRKRWMSYNSSVDWDAKPQERDQVLRRHYGTIETTR